MANEIVFDSTVYGYTGSNASNGTLGSGGSASAGFSFTSSSAGAGTISDLKIALQNFYVGGSSSVTAYLYNSDSVSNKPSSLLATLGTIDQTNFARSADNELIDFGSSTFTLAPSTRYWIILKEPGGNLIGTASGASGPSVMNEYVEYTDKNGNQTVAQDNSGNAALVSAKITEEVTCFATGTRLRTKQGDLPVEELAVGDVALTASGTPRPIQWIGRRSIGCIALNAPEGTWPVRIRAGAFGSSRPARELWLSPGHPVLVGADEDGDGGHLVPIMCLVNGTTIERVPVDTVTYWHVELEQHDILLAEGLPAESYLDWGDRAFFTEGADHALANPDFVVPGLAGRCRPVALDGPVVEAERRRLDAVFAMGLAEACAWPDRADDALFIDVTVGRTPDQLGRVWSPAHDRV